MSQPRDPFKTDPRPNGVLPNGEPTQVRDAAESHRITQLGVDVALAVLNGEIERRADLERHIHGNVPAADLQHGVLTTLEEARNVVAAQLAPDAVA